MNPNQVAKSYDTHPYGLASLPTTLLKDQQAYDISVSLTLPRSPPNTDRGNFMIALHLLDAPSPSSPDSSSSSSGPATRHPLSPRDLHHHVADKAVLFSTARPALLPYRDPLVHLAHRLLALPYYLLFPGKAEAETLHEGMPERLTFARGGPLPREVLVEVQAGQALQVYAVEVVLTAQLGGLRWCMYHYRVASFVALTGLFYGVEMGVVLFCWAVLGLLFAAGGRGGGKRKGLGMGPGKMIKVEAEGIGRRRKVIKDEDMSDTERTFPTTSRQQPLRYDASGRVKREDEGDEHVLRGAAPPPGPGAEADDEDELGDMDVVLDGHEIALPDEAMEFRDSGLGTGYSDHAGGGSRRDSMRRRRSGSEK